MIDERLDQNVRAALASEPPLGFDPDDVVDRAVTRQRRRRRITVTAGTTVAAVAAIAVVGTVVSQRNDTAPVGSGVAIAVECPDDPAAVVAPVVADLVAEQAPTVQFEPPTYDVNHDAGWCGVDADYRFVGDPERGGLRAELFVGKDVIEFYSNMDGASVTELPDGSHLVVTQGKPGVVKGAGSVVAHLRLDGQVAVAVITDFNKASIEQLTAIATDPRLTF